MILTCPACATQYRLKDDAIPPEGRQVRCAACKHKWHQDGADASEQAHADTAATPAHADDGGIAGGPPPPDPHHVETIADGVPEEAAQEQMIAENPMPDVPRQDEAAFAPVEDDARMPAHQWGVANETQPAEEHEFAAIPAMHDDDEAPRRSKLGWIVGLILIVVAAAAAFYFLAPPELKARAGIAEVGESPLQLMLTTSDRQRLASGNELLSISGRVINATERVQAVPPILAELRDPSDNRLVYKWTIPPPARSLAPGAAASFNYGGVDVPQGGESLSLRFAS